MNVSALHGQTPEEALIAYYDLISVGQMPMDIARLDAAADYDPFLGTEFNPSPTMALFDIAMAARCRNVDYSQPPTTGAEYKQRFGGVEAGTYTERFRSIRSAIVIDTLVEIIKEPIVGVENLGTVTEAAAEALREIESPIGSQLPSHRRKAIRKEVSAPFSEVADPNVQNRKTVVLGHLPNTRAARLADRLVRHH